MVAYQIGLPSPPGLIPAIPKYVISRKGPWGRGRVRFRRILRKYTRQGIDEAVASAGLTPRIDYLYNTPMPYIEEPSILYRIDPLTALEEIVSHPRGRVSHTLLHFLGEASTSAEAVGVTGTLALAIENDYISDIDLIIVTIEPSRFMTKFMEQVKPHPTLPWRRGYYRGVHVSWTGVNPYGTLHCPPLSSYWRIQTPVERGHWRVYVEPGQEAALLYPPCVESSDGRFIVSYEYNMGYTLYRGGYLLVDGVASSNVIYTGVGPASLR